MDLKMNIWVSLYILRVVEYPTLSLYKHLSLKQIKYSSFAKLFLAIAAIGTKYHTSITCTYRHTQTCQQRSYSNSYLWRRHLSFCFFFLIFPISKYFFPIFFSDEKYVYFKEWLLGSREDEGRKFIEKVSKFSPRWSLGGIFTRQLCS